MKAHECGNQWENLSGFPILQKKVLGCLVQIVTNSLRYAIWNLGRFENIKLTTLIIKLLGLVCQLMQIAK